MKFLCYYPVFDNTVCINRVLFENRPALYFCNYKENYKLIRVCWIPQIDDFITIMEQYIFNIRIIIIIISNKKKQYL